MPLSYSLARLFMLLRKDGWKEMPLNRVIEIGGMRPTSCQPSEKEKLIKIINKIIILPSRFLSFRLYIIIVPVDSTSPHPLKLVGE